MTAQMFTTTVLSVESDLDNDAGLTLDFVPQQNLVTAYEAAPQILLRRARWAARRQPGRVLVTGRGATIAAVQHLLAESATPDDQIVALDVHELAQRVITDRQLPVSTDAHLVEQAWQTAWGRLGAVLEPAGDSERWRQEVLGTIKERGLVRFTDYGTYDDPQALSVWDLYVSYTEELTRRFVHDRADLVAIALDELTYCPALVHFGAVVLDPAASLTPVMMQLLRTVGLGPDSAHQS